MNKSNLKIKKYFLKDSEKEAVFVCNFKVFTFKKNTKTTSSLCR